MWLIYIILGLALCLLYYIFQKFEQKIQKLPPGPFRFPGIGNLIQLYLTDRVYHVAMTKMTQKYGDIVYIQTGWVPSVVINGYEACKAVYNNDDYIGRIDDKWTADPTFGKSIGLVFASEQIWSESRRLVIKILRDFGWGKITVEELIIREEFEAFVDEIVKLTNGNGGKCTNDLVLFAAPMTNVVWTFVEGKTFEHFDPKFRELIMAAHLWHKGTILGGGLLNAYPILVKLTPGLIGYTKMKEHGNQFIPFFTNMIQEYRAKGDYKTQPENFIEIFLKAVDENKNDGTLASFILNDENLISLLGDFFIGASDTASNFLNFAILYLILFPDIQTELRKEIHRAIDGLR